jgi:hypothetical protein
MYKGATILKKFLQKILSFYKFILGYFIIFCKILFKEDY